MFMKELFFANLFRYEKISLWPASEFGKIAIVCFFNLDNPSNVILIWDSDLVVWVVTGCCNNKISCPEN